MEVTMSYKNREEMLAYYKEYHKKNYSKNKAKILKRNKNWRESKKGKDFYIKRAQSKERKEYMANYQKTDIHKSKSTWYRIKCRYGITKEQYFELVDQQLGLCIICSQIPDKFMIDHDHKTGQVRGLLCKQCNWLLGHSKESIEILQNAINYLERWKK
jgi:Autographiviridae endonuclease VII